MRSRCIANGILILWATALAGRGDCATPGQANSTPAAAVQASPQPVRPAAQGPLAPRESARLFTVPADLEFEQVLAEPSVRQPVFLNFDERGRMWIVQYLQYPLPAGLKIVSRDNYWRNIYDKVPPPPPHHFPGQDKITIHESTRGDGVFDKQRTFVDGLSIVTAVARGRGGVWVLNPPYLLFYPDANDDDVPDGDPVVHLAGFGLEDTHSVVNSLRWGPDGWLYGAQGSTVTSHVVRPGSKEKPVDSMGQLIWRYHPPSQRYEIFAEGGGNAFGLEIDSQGRIFSGHNGGDTRGFYYVQGAYCQKGFQKHGPLSNPYAFGYFPAMPQPGATRFSHQFLIYDGGALPAKYHGALLAIAPLQSEIIHGALSRDGSTFKTRDVSRLVTSQDTWFRPVDIKAGPDGAVYVCDWYDGQVNHYRNHEGSIDSTNGRIYRLRARSAKAAAPRDLTRLSSSELVDLLGDKNIWYRQTALRLLGDRRDASVIPKLQHIVQTGAGQHALEALWGLNLCGGLTPAAALELLEHPDPFVRLWTVRLCCDDCQVPQKFARRLARLAQTEPHVEVRSQLACSARRLPAADGLPIVAGLLTHEADVADPYIPLLVWWALESKCESDRDSVLSMWQDRQLWNTPLAKSHILTRLMQRYALAGTQQDLLVCARLFSLSPGAEQNKSLLQGFEAAFQGRSLTVVPAELIEALAKAGGETLGLRIRRGDAAAVDQALEIISDPQADKTRRLQCLEVFGQIRQPRCVDLLLQLLADSADDQLVAAALGSLQLYEEERIGIEVVSRYNRLPAKAGGAAQALLASRPSWARHFLQAIDAGKIDPRSVPLAVVRTILLHADVANAQLVAKHFGAVQGATTDELRREIERLAAVVEAGTGSPYKGKALFTQTCASCHRLFEEGGRVGPDLTSYRRDDLNNMLLNIVNPSATIREGYEACTLETHDGRVLSGVVVEQNNRVVTLRSNEGQDALVARDDIEDLRIVSQSIMPEGLLKPLTDQQIRDLFAYLRSGQPLD